ncbi:hypothetical protein Dimus_035676, partial [Dionaea muscipula]
MATVGEQVAVQEADCCRAPRCRQEAGWRVGVGEDDDEVGDGGDGFGCVADARDRLNGDGDEVGGGKTVKMMMEEERKWLMM